MKYNKIIKGDNKTKEKTTINKFRYKRLSIILILFLSFIIIRKFGLIKWIVFISIIICIFLN